MSETQEPTPGDESSGSAALLNTSQLKADPANPRKISKRGETGLAASLEQYGDLSGIVFNRRTGELVCGHQRLQQIRSKFGERPIVPIDEAAGLFGIKIDAEHVFPVRVVDWSKAKQRAANVTANNQKIGGDFTDGLEAYLLEVQADLRAEVGKKTLEDTLLLELMGVDGSNDTSITITPLFQVVVECDSETQQKERYDKIKALGYSCKLITV